MEFSYFAPCLSILEYILENEPAAVIFKLINRSLIVQQIQVFTKVQTEKKKEEVRRQTPGQSTEIIKKVGGKTKTRHVITH
jgi:hypothetical protein